MPVGGDNAMAEYPIPNPPPAPIHASSRYPPYLQNTDPAAVPNLSPPVEIPVVPSIHSDSPDAHQLAPNCALPLNPNRNPCNSYGSGKVDSNDDDEGRPKMYWFEYWDPRSSSTPQKEQMEAPVEPKNKKKKMEEFLVKLLPEESGENAVDVLCQIGLDGIHMLDPITSRTLRFYPLETIRLWEVTDAAVYAFWTKSSLDMEPRRTRLQSRSFSAVHILDAVENAIIQFEKKGRSAYETFKLINEKEKDVVSWLHLMKLGQPYGYLVDDTITKCKSCGKDFSNLVLKHRCNHCRGIFCDKCTQGKILKMGVQKEACEQCEVEFPRLLVERLEIEKGFGKGIDIASEKKISFASQSLEHLERKHQLPKGRVMVEVFSVCIEKIDGEGPHQLYGKIGIISGDCVQVIYNREKESPDTICQGGTVLLTGPTAIPDYEESLVYIDLNLYALDQGYQDYEISCGIIQWDIFRFQVPLNKPLRNTVLGTDGAATVNYVVWKRAMQATVEVTFFDGDGEGPAKVCGELSACNRKFENQEIVLFHREDGIVNVRPGQLIPLVRSVVAVPMRSSLKIKANLKHYDNTLGAGPGIAQGTAKFPVLRGGISKEYIEGEKGKVRLQVTWWDVVHATVKVVLIEGDPEGPTKVHGHLFAHNSKHENYISELFWKKDDSTPEVVRIGKLIPLLRSAVVVPWGTSLIIKAYLRHHSVVSADPLIADGTAAFFAQTEGTVEKLIHGEKGCIQVKVTWTR